MTLARTIQTQHWKNEQWHDRKNVHNTDWWLCDDPLITDLYV